MKRKLQLKSGPRKALLKNLASSLILHEKIKITLPRAKELRSYIDRLVVVAKKNNLSSRRYLLKHLPKNVVTKMVEDIEPSFNKRNSGFTKIVKIDERKGDNASLCLISFSEREKIVIKKKKSATADKEKSKNEKTSKKKP